MTKNVGKSQILVAWKTPKMTPPASHFVPVSHQAAGLSPVCLLEGCSARLTAQARASSIKGKLIICACKSPYKKVKKGNSVMGATSPSSALMAREAVQNQSPG